MTDFISLSSIGDPSSFPEPPWAASAPPPRRQRPAPPRAPVPARSVATIAATVHQLLAGLSERRVPRVDQLRQQLQQAECGWDLRETTHALRALHDATGALDFLAGRGGQAKGEEFRQQGVTVGAAARRLGSAAMVFLGKQASDAAVARLLWIDLQLECHELEKRVRKGLGWVVDMEHELAQRQEAATAEVSQRALQELARRCQSLEDRLHLVNGLCGAARAARGLGQQVARQRTAVAASLQDKVRPRGLALQHALQPLLDAAGTRALEAAELLAAIDARHDLQVALTEAGADLLQLQSLQKELDAQLAWMEQKAVQAS